MSRTEVPQLRKTSASTVVSSSISIHVTSKASPMNFFAHLRAVSSKDAQQTRIPSRCNILHIWQSISSHQRNIPEALILLELFQYLFLNYWGKHQFGANNFLPLSPDLKWETPCKSTEIIFAICLLSLLWKRGMDVLRNTLAHCVRSLSRQVIREIVNNLLLAGT